MFNRLYTGTCLFWLTKDVYVILSISTYLLLYLQKLQQYLTRHAWRILLKTTYINMDTSRCIQSHSHSHINTSAILVLRPTHNKKNRNYMSLVLVYSFKVLVLVYKCRNGLGPGYLTSTLSAYTPVCGLLSASYGLLVEPRSRLKTVGDRAFSVVGPREWNRLPGEIRDCQTLGAFKRKLKTHLFRAANGL